MLRDNALNGVIAAIPTQIDAAGNFDKSLFSEHCQWVLENGCDALNILGTTGEANSLNESTRRDVMTAAAETVSPKKLMVGTATPDLDTTISLTKFADELGYGAALILPPYYYKPVSDDQLFDWFEKLDSALEGSDLPIYLYNFPVMTGIKFSVEFLTRLTTAMPKRYRGIKDSSGDIPYCKEIVAALPDFKVFPSNEVSLAEAHDSGFAGCISATVNVTAPWAGKLWHRDVSEIPEHLTEKLHTLRSGISTVPLIPAVKYLVALRQGKAETVSYTPPLMPLTNGAIENLKPIIEELGYTN